MHNTVSIRQKGQQPESFSSIFHVVPQGYNSNGTATLLLKREMSWGVDEFQITIPPGAMAFEMSQAGNTLNVYYPTPKE